MTSAAEGSASRQLSKAERRLQLLDTALLIVRQEGAARLTLGHLAMRAGVSKPVAYDHSGTRSGLLIELYRWIDMKWVSAFQGALTTNKRGLQETAEMLAKAYIHCAADTNGEFYAVRAALSGSEVKTAVFEGLLDNCVRMFVSVLKPHSTLPPVELERSCIGLVGAGEAFSAALVRGRYSEAEAVSAFTSLIQVELDASRR